MATSTLHVDDSQAEIHKLVVGPMDNNVFVVRCKETCAARSMCFQLEGSPILFSGDTLFPSRPGNTKSEGCDFTTFNRSVDGLIYRFDDNTLFLIDDSDDT